MTKPYAELAVVLDNKRDFIPNDNWIATLVDIELLIPHQMPTASKYGVKIQDATKTFERIRKFATSEIKKLKEFKNI